MNLARQLNYLRRHELSTTDADELADVIARMATALEWMRNTPIRSGPVLNGHRVFTSEVRKRAADALKGVE